MTEELGMAHRLAAVPARIDPELAPLVAAMHRCSSVADLVALAPSLVPDAPAEECRRAALGLVRVAATKGFVALHPRRRALSFDEARPCV
ncbi:MAG: hypothetical protein ABJE95_01555 [Byssovorax sp.]